MKTSGLSRLAVVAALAAGVLLALAAMPGCGSDCPTPEQAAYLNKVKDWATSSKTGHEELQTVLGEVETRPEALIDEGWRLRLRGVLDELNSGYEAISDLQAPAGMQEVRSAVVRGTDAANEANELLWQGILEVDAELIYGSATKINEAVRLFEDLLVIVERFCE